MILKGFPPTKYKWGEHVKLRFTNDLTHLTNRWRYYSETAEINTKEEEVPVVFPVTCISWPLSWLTTMVNCQINYFAFVCLCFLNAPLLFDFCF